MMMEIIGRLSVLGSGMIQIQRGVTNDGIILHVERDMILILVLIVAGEIMVHQIIMVDVHVMIQIQMQMTLPPLLKGKLHKMGGEGGMVPIQMRGVLQNKNLEEGGGMTLILNREA